MFEPMNPAPPVTRIRSSFNGLYSILLFANIKIWEQKTISMLITLLVISVFFPWIRKSNILLPIAMAYTIHCIFPFNNDGFNYYDLALQKCNQTGGYSIHGLWPQIDEKHWPEYCSKMQFNISDLQPIIQEMNNSWHSCFDNNIDFWTHEWEKHGTCSQLPILTYFNRTLILFGEAINNQSIIDKCGNKTECLLQVSKDFNFIDT